jgi:holo-[acyl-carrier protein] synthase
VIVGIGIDLVSVPRIARAMRRPRFLARVLTEGERRICLTPEEVAGRWAAKEALVKCIPYPLRWQKIEVLSEPSGKPVMTVRDAPDPEYRYHVSISHERDKAVAIVVVERL